MASICRVCLGNSGELVNIFNQMRSAKTSIAEMISKCTGYEVQKGDSFPETICPPCLVDARNAFEIRITAERSHHVFCQVRDNGIEEVLCKLLEDEDWETPSNNSEWSDNDTEVNDKQSDPAEKAKPLDTRPNISSHFVARPFKCEHCPGTFRNKCVLRIHMRTHTGEKPLKCTHCPKSFAQHSSLISHIRIHTGERPYKCDRCSKAFKAGTDLLRHKRVHDGIRPHQCPHCLKFFAIKPQLRDHIRSHTGERPFKCTKCPRAFSLKQHLKEHVRDHPFKDKVVFKCHQCAKTFTQKSGLREHTRIHTGEKPFQCPHCSKSYAHSTTLQGHIRTHTKEKPYKCYKKAQKMQ
ncbi:hypothetical protein KR009_000347 [Drosophila setifemur]|nr:hypothetical protein KR009_000347 [Drosophila setifemur]